MNVPVENQYQYDEPLGLYGHESQQRLAQGVIQDLVRYEETHENVVVRAKLPYLGVSRPPIEEFRISSIVESSTARLGYALAVAPPSESDRATMGGVFYSIDREDPGVVEQKDLVVARPETFRSNLDYKDEVAGLMHRFDKSELEAVMRMLGKMTTSLELARTLQVADEEVPAELSIAGQMKHATKIKHTKSILKRTSVVEPFVLSALHNHSRHKLHNLFPKDRPFQKPHDRDIEPVRAEHILEWQEFTDAASDLLDKESVPDGTTSYVNVQYEQEGKIYYIKLAADSGQLFGVQILCDDTGAWKTQLFDLETHNDEDRDDLNLVSPIWDKDELLAGLRHGEVINDEAYECYRALAERSLTASFKTPDNLIYIQAA